MRIDRGRRLRGVAHLVLTAALAGRRVVGGDGEAVVAQAPARRDLGEVVPIVIVIRILALHGVGHVGASPM